MTAKTARLSAITTFNLDNDVIDVSFNLASNAFPTNEGAEEEDEEEEDEEEEEERVSED